MHLGSLTSIDRFAVKSMLGESLTSAPIGTSGIAGDRTHALLDAVSGKVASAKDPRAWAGLLHFRSWYDGSPETPNLVIAEPGGAEIHVGDGDADGRLSEAVGRPVRLATESADSVYDYVWAEDGIAPDDVITGSQTSTTDDGRPVSTMPLAFMAPGTFQDVAPITIITTGGPLRSMAELHPDGAWDREALPDEPPESTPTAANWARHEWPGRRLRIGPDAGAGAPRPGSR